jgi:hypothetical protein
VGITSGAYSSIFIAAPLLTMWKEREPEWARRKAADEETRADATTNGGTEALDEQTLEDAEQAAADAPTPELVPVAAATSDRIEKRRQRRKSRPHGRPR